jgi:hypothetical protein
MILEMEYGEVEGERIGRGIICCLKIINNLEINEQTLNQYAQFKTNSAPAACTMK